MTTQQKIQMLQKRSFGQIASSLGCTPEQLAAGYQRNLEGLREMRDKGLRTGKKVNGYDQAQLADMVVKYEMLATESRIYANKRLNNNEHENDN